MDIEHILNDALNKALCSKNRIQQPNSNNIAEFVNEYLAAINYTHCRETLKIKDLMTFKDYKTNLFIKAEGVYQPKKTKLFVWYSKKQLKRMYNNEPL